MHFEPIWLVIACLILFCLVKSCREEAEREWRKHELQWQREREARERLMKQVGWCFVTDATVSLDARGEGNGS